MHNTLNGVERLQMRAKLVILIIVLLVFLAGCGYDPESKTEQAVPDDHTTTFNYLCDPTHHIGMWVASYSEYHEAFGYSVRMTQDEYREVCNQFEK